MHINMVFWFWWGTACGSDDDQAQAPLLNLVSTSAPPYLHLAPLQLCTSAPLNTCTFAYLHICTTDAPLNQHQLPLLNLWTSISAPAKHQHLCTCVLLHVCTCTFALLCTYLCTSASAAALLHLCPAPHLHLCTSSKKPLHLGTCVHLHVCTCNAPTSAANSALTCSTSTSAPAPH
jgi:hypothetical protein